MAGRPRQFDKDSTLKQALDVFLEKGYEGSSLDDLCAAMGITRPSLYKAYGNKEALFLAALSTYRDRFIEQVKAILESESNGKQAIRKLLTWIDNEHTAEETPTGCLVVNSGIICNEGYPQIADKIAILHDQRENILFERLKRAHEEGQLKTDTDPRALAQYINGILQGIAVLARGQRKPEVIHNIVTLANLTLDQV
ncbi:MAG: TetR/AcrR family transcriptional regulator [Candidatus Thiodiazotropha taylori]